MTDEQLKADIRNIFDGSVSAGTTGLLIRLVKYYHQQQLLHKPDVRGSLPLTGGEIIGKAINRSKDIDKAKYDAVSYRFGYIAGFEEAQGLAVGGNDR